MNTKKLKQLVLDLAIHGKLVPQDPNDEPASELLKRIKENVETHGRACKSKKTAISSEEIDEVPFDVPTGWCWTTVGEITPSLQYGTSEKSSSSGKVAVLRMGNITRNGTIDYSDLVYTSNDKDIESLLLKKGDVLFNRTNSSEWVGKTAIYDGKIPAIYAGYIIRMTPYLVNPNFLTFVMISQYERNWCNDVKTDGVNQSNINSQKLSSFRIPLPPLAEQHRIVAAIEKWFAVIDQLESNEGDLKKSIEQTKKKVLDLAIHGKLVKQDERDEPASELLKRIKENVETHGRACKGKKAVSQDIDLDEVPFEVPKGWVWCRLGMISNYGECQNVDVKSINDSEWTLELEDLEKDSAKILSRQTISSRPLKGTRHKFSQGDVLYSKLRTYLNKVLVAKENGYCTTEIIPIRFFGNIDSDFMCHVLRSQYFLDYTAILGFGVKMPRLSTEDARKAYIPLPPLSEQKRIVAKVEEVFGELERIGEMLG